MSVILEIGLKKVVNIPNMGPTPTQEHAPIFGGKSLESTRYLMYVEKVRFPSRELAEVFLLAAQEAAKGADGELMYADIRPGE